MGLYSHAAAELLKAMSNYRPIGIFDSGVGGLSIAKSIRELLPNENLLYVADSQHAPYGNQSCDFIAQRVHAISSFLIKNDAKAIVIACNTATVFTATSLRNKFSLPIIAVEPGIKPATIMTRNGVIGILATTQTVNSLSFQNLVKRFSADNIIAIQACPELATQVEKLELNNHKTKQLLQAYLQPLLDKGMDTLVLGCTHYGFLTELIQSIIGPEITIINTEKPVALQVKRRMERENLLSSLTGPSFFKAFSSSSDQDQARRIMSQLWGSPLEIGTFAHQIIS